ncbi:hypothetical protein Glove_132g276 [Diversispora epigaea]|uniref:Endonuclease/exonuclease/phosphatase domain-containing protein n=1 Tax=Diversispora epigaea TaxID=1348612 RepID=A0A397J261_9GLOM|nr:hypothetical protein Glove_132g276 [Diversispora epigaea]
MEKTITNLNNNNVYNINNNNNYIINNNNLHNNINNFPFTHNNNSNQININNNNNFLSLNNHYEKTNKNQKKNGKNKKNKSKKLKEKSKKIIKKQKEGNKETEYKKSVKTWKIATQNIKGLKDKTKQNLFWNQYIKSNLDIIFIQETNIKKETKESFFSHTHSTQTKEKYLVNEPENYQTWISSLDKENKKLGHGIAISIKKEIALHVFKVKELKGYALQLLLSFKGKYIVQLITVYNLPQTTENATIRLKLKNWIIENLNEGKSKNWYSILEGDWNITLNLERDRKTTQEVSISATNRRKSQSSILNHIKFMGYKDTYELLNDKNKETEEKHFTCIKTNENYTSMSRIDAIWIDRDIIPKVLKYKTVDTM